MKKRTILKSFSRMVFPTITFLFICFSAVSGLAFPTTISPGNCQFIVSVSECCPTFSWAAVEGADSYEIAVFSIQNPEQIIPDTLYDELRQISVPILTTMIPAPALSWTPTKEQGFTPGKTYAWHVRSLMQNSPGEWSTAAFFKVPETTITNLDTAVGEAVTDFLTEPDENFTFWSGLEERIAEMVTDKITESSASASAANLRGGSEGDIGASGTNVWYGYKAGDTIDANGGDNTKYNVFIGRYAGTHTYDTTVGNIKADNNVFVGYASGYINTTGSKNAFVGYNSGRNSTTADYNSFFGCESGYSNTTGGANAFFGSHSGFNSTTANYNSFFGCESGYNSTTANYNSFFGYDSGYSNTTGGANAFFGSHSGFNNITGSSNAFFGSHSGYNNITGSSNAFFGSHSGYNSTTGDYNAFFGCDSGNINTTGSSNAFFGSHSGYFNGAGDQNAFVGSYSGYSNSSGEGNAFFGSESGYGNSSGKENAFFGLSSGYLNTTGGANAFFGCRSGYSNSSGEGNVFFGCRSGYSNTGNNNVFIGYEAGFNETGSNKLYIANSDTALPLIYGDFAAKQLKVNGTLEFTTAFATSDRRWKKDIKPLDDSLAKVLRLNGKSYLWRRDEFPEKGFSDQRQIGLIAQEVEKIIPELVNTDKDGYKSISYNQIIPLLVEAVKELNSTVETLKNENAELRAQVKKSDVCRR